MSDKPESGERKALASKSFDEWMDTLPDIDQRAFQSRRSYMAGYAAALAAPAEPPRMRKELVAEIELARSEGYKNGLAVGWDNGRKNALEEIETERSVRAANAPAEPPIEDEMIDQIADDAARKLSAPPEVAALIEPADAQLLDNTIAAFKRTSDRDGDMRINNSDVAQHLGLLMRMRAALARLSAPVPRQPTPPDELATLLSILRNPYGRYEDLRDSRLKAADCIESLYADATRYRWLRAHSTGPTEPWSSHDNPESLDAVVDASIASEPSPCTR